MELLEIMMWATILFSMAFLLGASVTGIYYEIHFQRTVAAIIASEYPEEVGGK